MEEETKNWFNQAEKDFSDAEDSFDSEKYEWASFQAQQSVEKALKSLYIKKYNKLIKTHDVVFLAREINAPEEIITFCRKINPSYIDTRYPDLAKNYSKGNSKEILNITKKVLSWIKNNL